MRKFLFFWGILSGVVSTANSQQFQWARTYGQSSYDNGSAICTDASGNVYAAGIFQGSVDFDPGPGQTLLTAVGFEDICITKHDANGNFIWAVQFKGDQSNEHCSFITTDDSSNVYLTGFFTTATDFATDTSTTILTPVGSADIFMVKLGSDGNLKWAKQMGGTGYDQSNGIQVAANGDVFIAGNFEGTADFNPDPVAVTNLVSAGYDDVFVGKYSNSGNLIWVKKATGSSLDYGTGLELDASGNAYVIGWFINTVDFDPGNGVANLTTSGNWDAFIWKLDNAGNYVWAKQLVGASGIGGQSIGLDATGNVYAAGYFLGSIDLDPGPGTDMHTSVAGNEDMFLVKLNNNGDFVWGNTFGDVNADRCNSIDVDADGTVAMTGYFEGTVDFDPGVGTFELTSDGPFNDIFITKLDASGALLWAGRIGYIIQDKGACIVLKNDTIYTTGYFAGNNVDLDPGPGYYGVNTTLASADIYVLKLGGCILDTAVIQNEVVLTANTSAGTYQWIDCSNNAPVNGATSQTFSPSVNGSYAVVITQGSCSDTSACFTISTLQVNEENQNSTVTVFPNPATSQVQILLNETVVTVSIFNAIGQLVQTENKSGFSVENLPAGIYLVQVKTTEGIQNTRLIKN